MNLKNRMILETYRNQRKQYEDIGNIVHKKLAEIISKAGIRIVAIEHRIKKEDSLAGKLEKKGERYSSIDDIHDILGARVICYFNDDVDRIGELVEKNFKIDYKASVDKRTLLTTNAFGYQSLHYTCYLLNSNEYPKEYCQKEFEIQIRTNLQHTWAQIEHDLGYKNEFGIPRSIARSFAGIASLLEFADNEFIRVRESMKAYTDEIREKITNDNANDLPVNSITLQEYIYHNQPMKEFLDNLSKESNAELYIVPSEAYVEQLKFFGIKTLGQLSRFRERNLELATKLAKTTLQSAELDMVSSNVAVRYLCRAELINGDYSEEDIIKFLTMALGNEERAKRQAKYLMKLKSTENQD